MEVMHPFERDLNAGQSFGKLILQRINQHLKLALIKNLILLCVAHIILSVFKHFILIVLHPFVLIFKGIAKYNSFKSMLL